MCYDKNLKMLNFALFTYIIYSSLLHLYYFLIILHIYTISLSHCHFILTVEKNFVKIQTAFL